MKMILSLVFTVLLAIATVGSGDAAFAQGRSRGRFYSKVDVDRLIRTVERDSDRFKDYFDADIDRTRFDKTRTEDRVWEHVKELETALDRLRNRFDRTDTWRDTRDDLGAALREARDIDGFFRRFRISNRVHTTWQVLRRDLNTLAGVYNLPPV